jgi:hypothetical protein
MVDDRDPFRRLETITPEQWASLPRSTRVLFNRLRQERGWPPLSESAPATPAIPEWWAQLTPDERAKRNRRRVELGLAPRPHSGAAPPAPPSSDPPTSAAAAGCEFLGLDDDPEAWKGIAKHLALELAHAQMADRGLRKDTLHRAIARFVTLAMTEGRWRHKKAVTNAMKIFNVGRSTVEAAIAEYPGVSAANTLVEEDAGPGERFVVRRPSSAK